MSHLDWKVRDKVVCVDAEWTGGKQKLGGVPCPLEMNKVYTIRAFANQFGFYHSQAVHPVIFLDEVEHPNAGCGFNVARFRPVQTRKTDIAIFTRMLTPSPKKERVS